MKKEKNELDMLLTGTDRGLAELIAQKLSESKDVTFAAANYTHPLKGTPHLLIKAPNAKKELFTAIGEIRRELEEFEDELKKKQ